MVDIKQMNKMETKNVIMDFETYEVPICQVMNFETEGAILGTSSIENTGSATHDNFEEVEYNW